MAEILDNIYLILIIPFWIFLIIMLGRFFSVYVNKKIIYSLSLLSSFLGVILSGMALWSIKPDTILETELPFIKINDFIISFGILVDRTALIFALVLFLVSFIVQFYSIFYMCNEKKNYRFYALLNLFNFSMAGLFFSPNLFQSYVFWEIAGIVSYLLIGFEYFKSKKSTASQKVLIINRIGDTALISGIILCSYFVYTYSNPEFATLSFVDMNAISTFVYAYTSTPLFMGICGLFIIGAAVKSAQLPFYTWLQDAMEAKLPVSALLHSATLVASGIFLIIRLMPFFTLEGTLLKTIAGMGILTALICSLSACSQTHPKKVLAYSTSAQLGLIFLAIGTLNLKAAFALFIAHAFIKSGLFLTLPKEGEKFSFGNFILFLLGGLSLSGLMFAGAVSKEMIYGRLSGYVAVIFCIISFLTAFYIIKIALVTGFSKEEKTDKYEFSSPLILFILNILFYIYLREHAVYKIAEPFWSALTAWICVYILYMKNAFIEIPLFREGFYLDKFYTTTVVTVYEKFSQGLNFIDTKVLANYKPAVILSKAGVKTSAFIEKYIMDGGVNIVSQSAKGLSRFNMIAQSGNIQRYNAYAFIIITVILTCLIIGYTAIIAGG